MSKFLINSELIGSYGNDEKKKLKEDITSKSKNNCDYNLYVLKEKYLKSGSNYVSEEGLDKIEEKLDNWISIITGRFDQIYDKVLTSVNKVSIPDTETKRKYRISELVKELNNLWSSALDEGYKIAENYPKDQKSSPIGNGGTGTPGSDTVNQSNNTTTTDTTSSSSTYGDNSEEDVDKSHFNEAAESRYYSKIATYANRIPTNTRIKTLRGVLGLPYQFLPDTDRRISSDEDKKKSTFKLMLTGDYEQKMGRKYIERIAQRANIAFLSPGRATFLANASKTEKSDILSAIVQGTDAALKSIVNDLMKDGESIKYYSFENDTQEYYEYLNPILHSVSRYLNIHNETIQYNDGTLKKLYEADWEKVLGDPEGLLENAYGSLAFYCDGINSSSESLNNQTTESALAGQINNNEYSEMARELAFVGGKAVSDFTGSNFIDNMLSKDSVNKSMEAIDDFVGKYVGNNRLIKNLSKSALSLVSGGHIIFPKIWSDSSFERGGGGITLNFRFVSPDTDKYSIFYNILVPFYALLCMAAPRGYSTLDAYGAPFLIRAFCQSMFNIELGMITSMSIQKGAEGAWTIDGLPTVLECSVTIEDLYSRMYISNGDYGVIEKIRDGKSVFEKSPYLKNTTLLNWIATSCGVNITKSDVLRDIELYVLNTALDPLNNFIGDWTRGLADQMASWTPRLVNIMSIFKS